MFSFNLSSLFLILFSPGAFLVSSLNGKVSGFSADTYEAVTGLAYDATNKKLGLKVGADTVIPFSGDDFNEVLLKANFPINSNIRSDATNYEFKIGDNTAIVLCCDSNNLNKTQMLYKIGQTVHVSGAAENDFTWTSRNTVTLKRSSTLGYAYIDPHPLLNQ